jgi:enamine deaminase RidA (YjgF/YER057c/UK114 family)
LENQKVALRAAGADLDDVLKTTVYVATHEQEDLLTAWEVVDATSTSTTLQAPCSESACSVIEINWSRSRPSRP